MSNHKQYFERKFAELSGGSNELCGSGKVGDRLPVSTEVPKSGVPKRFESLPLASRKAASDRVQVSGTL